MSRTLSIALVGVLALGVFSADATAQRDAGAKARGEVGTGFWTPANRRPRNSVRAYAFRSATVSRQVATTAVVDANRSFSYQPVDFHAGDRVLIDRDDVKLMMGSKVVGRLENGSVFQVTRVINGWLGAVIENEGQKLEGWVWHGNAAKEGSESNSEEATEQSASGQVMRSFSYEPALATPLRQATEQTQRPRRNFSPEDRQHPGRHRFPE